MKLIILLKTPNVLKMLCCNIDVIFGENQITDYTGNIQDYTQFKRIEELYTIKSPKHIRCKEDHLNNIDRFVVLPIVEISSTEKARQMRDKFIDIGFEGLILMQNTNLARGTTL